jgi:hypothetical protein
MDMPSENHHREMPTPPADRLRRMALRVAAQGFYVFAVQRGGKTPAVENRRSAVGLIH